MLHLNKIKSPRHSLRAFFMLFSRSNNFNESLSKKKDSFYFNESQADTLTISNRSSMFIDLNGFLLSAPIKIAQFSVIVNTTFRVRCIDRVHVWHEKWTSRTERRYWERKKLMMEFHENGEKNFCPFFIIRQFPLFFGWFTFLKLAWREYQMTPRNN